MASLAKHRGDMASKGEIRIGRSSLDITHESWLREAEPFKTRLSVATRLAQTKRFNG